MRQIYLLHNTTPAHTAKYSHDNFIENEIQQSGNRNIHQINQHVTFFF